LHRWLFIVQSFQDCLFIVGLQPVVPADIPPMLAGVRQGVGNGTKGIQSRKGD